MLVGYLILLSIGCCLAVPTILQIGATVENQNGTVLTLIGMVDDIKVVRDVENRILYTVSREKKSYIDAGSTCKDNGMRLLRVDSPKKHEAVKLLIETFTSEGPFWMAAVRLGGDKWKWPKGKLIDHYYWDQGEPNNASGNEQCIELYHRGALWDDHSCSEKIYFICEYIGYTKPGNDKNPTTPKSDLIPSRRVIKKEQVLRNSIY